MELSVQVICRQLPASVWTEQVKGKWVRREQIHLGLQRGEVIEAAVAVDAEPIVFDLLFTVRQQANGEPNFLGPYAKGAVADRFFYLVWATPAADGRLTMFRRVKVPLHYLSWDAVARAVQEVRPIEVELTLTDASGAPRSASLRADELRWSV
ncbi:MAG: DUF5990 family protein [Caldilineaceae bacterium]